jgi:hypothetical protein
MFHVNPFQHGICHVFLSNGDGLAHSMVEWNNMAYSMLEWINMEHSILEWNNMDFYKVNNGITRNLITQKS